VLLEKMRYFSVVPHDRFAPKKWLPHNRRPLQRTEETQVRLTKELKFLVEVGSTC
jgi:hypothetical protein